MPIPTNPKDVRWMVTGTSIAKSAHVVMFLTDYQEWIVTIGDGVIIIKDKLHDASITVSQSMWKKLLLLILTAYRKDKYIEMWSARSIPTEDHIQVITLTTDFILIPKPHIAKWAYHYIKTMEGYFGITQENSLLRGKGRERLSSAQVTDT